MALLIASSVFLCVMIVVALVLGHRWLVAHERKHFGGTRHVNGKGDAPGALTRVARAFWSALVGLTRPIDWSGMSRREGKRTA